MPDNKTYTYLVNLLCTVSIAGTIEDECRHTINADLRDIVGVDEHAISDNGAVLWFYGYEIGNTAIVLPRDSNDVARIERARTAYIKTIGYDPFTDDPENCSLAEVEQILSEYAEAEAGAEAMAQPAPTLDDGKVHYRCPECGDREHLYARADTRWNFAAQEWVVSEQEVQIECTECDWTGTTEAAIYNGDDEFEPEEDPCPIHRQPVSRCPASCNHGEA